jgi:hypothetical protein
MNRSLFILLLTGTLALTALSGGCKSKEKRCKDQAKMDCFGEATQGKAKKSKDGKVYSCFDARYAACLGRE